jgi:uncharacterized membrane protein
MCVFITVVSFLVVCFGTAYWHLIMKYKCFKCIDLFIVTVERTNPLAIFMYHHLFNLKKKKILNVAVALLVTIKLQINYVAKK